MENILYLKISLMSLKEEFQQELILSISSQADFTVKLIRFVHQFSVYKHEVNLKFYFTYIKVLQLGLGGTE